MAAIVLGPGFCALLTAAAWICALIIRRSPHAGVAWALALGSIGPGMAVEQGHSARLQGMGVDGVVVGRIVRAEPLSSPRMVELEALGFREFDPAHRPLRVRRIRLTLHAPDDPLRQARIGEIWELPMRLRSPRGMVNLGTGDPERNLFRAGIDAKGYVRGEGAQRLSGAPGGLRLANVRQWASEGLAAAAPGVGGRHLRALLIGDRSALTSGDWALLAATGTTHLLVVSGLHVGMVAGVMLWITSLSGLRSRRPGLAMLAMLLAASAYAALTGFELPVQRALLMLAVGTLMLTAHRHAPPLAALLAAAVVVLMFDPLAPLSAGFWLSFLAVAALMLVISGRRPGGMSAWRGTLLAQLAVTTLLALPLALAFGRLPVWAPLVNLVAIPVVALIVLPLGLVTGLALAIGIPAAGMAVGILAEALAIGLAGLDALPDIAVPMQVAGGTLVPLTVLAAVLVWMPWPWPLRVGAALILLALLLPGRDAPAAGEFRVHVLDVGQGHAAVVRTANHVLVYDSGPAFGTDSDAGARVVIPVLAALGVPRVDSIVLSHAHFDHIGGVRSLASAFPDANLYSPVPLPARFPAAEACHAGMNWVWDGVHFEVLLPEPEVAGDPRWFNRHSCVLSVRGRSGAVLLPGDIDVFAERRLAGRLGRKDLVVAPHHGSYTSSGRVLVRLTMPRFVVVPAGCPSPFGHPHPLVVARWQAVGAEVVSTGLGGMLSWDSSAADQLRGLREERQRYWHWRAEQGCE